MNRAQLVALLAVALVLGSAVDAAARRHGTTRGTIYIPDDLAPDAVVPVVIVEGGLASGVGKLWPLLRDRTQAIVAETVSLRSMLERPEGGGEVGKAIDNVLEEAQKRHDISKAPWIVVGFSKAAPHMANVALGDPQQFQGYLQLSGLSEPSHLQVDLAAARGMPVGIVHGLEDSVAPILRAKTFRSHLEEAGLSVTYTELDTSDPMAPVQEAGAEAVLAFLEQAAKQPVEPRPVERLWYVINTKTADDLTMTGDLYETKDKTARVVVLFHQARSSRGEYRPIAARLVREGYNVLAIDQRSGAQWGGVLNETAARAKDAGLKQTYSDARVDLERGIAWARDLGLSGKLAIWGSSYSAALSILLGAEQESVDAVIAFSPGEYLSPRGCVGVAALELKKPTLIVCPPREEAQAQTIYERVAAEDKALYVHPRGLHGSRTLYLSPEPAPAWEKVLAFLEEHLD